MEAPLMLLMFLIHSDKSSVSSVSHRVMTFAVDEMDDWSDQSLRVQLDGVICLNISADWMDAKWIFVLWRSYVFPFDFGVDTTSTKPAG